MTGKVVISLPNGRSIASRLSDRLRGAPPTALVLFPIISVQLGAAVAKSLFDSLGPGGAVFLRIAFAAFVGPLGVAVAGSRRVLDLLWVVLAAAGILLLAPLGVLGGMELDPVGVAFALLAGCLWACYILLSASTGSAIPGGTGLVIALCVGTLVLFPFGIAGAGYALLDPKLLLAGFGVAMLSSAIPYSLELEALRKLPARVFGVLMSLDPAVAALLFVTIAAAGASLFGGRDKG